MFEHTDSSRIAVRNRFEPHVVALYYPLERDLFVQSLDTNKTHLTDQRFIVVCLVTNRIAVVTFFSVVCHVSNRIAVVTSVSSLKPIPSIKIIRWWLLRSECGLGCFNVDNMKWEATKRNTVGRFLYSPFQILKWNVFCCCWKER